MFSGHENVFCKVINPQSDLFSRQAISKPGKDISIGMPGRVEHV